MREFSAVPADERTTLLDGLVDRCFEALEAGGSQQDFLAADAYLAQFDINVASASIHLQHTEGPEADVEPLRPICPDGSDGCHPKCRIIKGKQHCVWVCNCPDL